MPLHTRAHAHTNDHLLEPDGVESGEELAVLEAAEGVEALAQRAREEHRVLWDHHHAAGLAAPHVPQAEAFCRLGGWRGT